MELAIMLLAAISIFVLMTITLAKRKYHPKTNNSKRKNPMRYVNYYDSGAYKRDRKGPPQH